MIKHKKFKNTAILFNLLLKQLTGDVLSENKNYNQTIEIIKKYFNKDTELTKELILYHSLSNVKYNELNEEKFETLLNEVYEQYKKINLKKLKKEKFNLIREIKNNFDLKKFLSIRVENYPVYAAIYTLLESKVQNKFFDPKFLIDSKKLIYEHLCKLNETKSEPEVLKQYKNLDYSTRELAFQILVEKFNQKYKNLNDKQKNLLKKYIFEINDYENFLNFLRNEYKTINEEIKRIKKVLKNSINDDDEKKILLIKLEEVQKRIEKNQNLKGYDENTIYNLLNCYSLVEELNHYKNEITEVDGEEENEDVENVSEISTTGEGEAYNTPFAFSKDPKKLNVATKILLDLGYKVDQNQLDKILNQIQKQNANL